MAHINRIPKYAPLLMDGEPRELDGYRTYEAYLYELPGDATGCSYYKHMRYRIEVTRWIDTLQRSVRVGMVILKEPLPAARIWACYPRLSGVRMWELTRSREEHRVDIAASHYQWGAMFPAHEYFAPGMSPGIWP